eukprot:TRINITY_DN11282_c0_g1_i1.p2 TRINITY_DN11282_c0_g1~~TRINITY_DN11282_c0_g1_i1.p2  ORF type:complete len:273 (+),score=72.98 TRINITY_DN11282_c0_g1_i1:101-919(+)
MQALQVLLGLGNAALLLSQVYLFARGRARRVAVKTVLLSLLLLHAAQALLWIIRRHRFARLRGVFHGRVSGTSIGREYPVHQPLDGGRYVSRLGDARLCLVVTTPVDSYTKASRVHVGPDVVDELRDDSMVAQVVEGVPLDHLVMPDLNVGQMVSAAQQLCRFLTDRHVLTRQSVCVTSFTPLGLVNKAVPVDSPGVSPPPPVDRASTAAAGACLTLLYTGSDDPGNLALLTRMAPQPLVQLVRDMLSDDPPAPEILAQHLQVFTTVFDSVL